jgi:hypothetical protein
MKKLLLAGGESLLRIGAVLAVMGITCLFAPSSHAQTPSFALQFEGLPSGTVDLTKYIGLDRKLKTDVAGQVLHVRVSPALTKSQRVQLSIAVSATGSSVAECNTQIATANTVPFDITGSGRDLGASDFTGSSGIGVQSSTTVQPCIDGMADKMKEGVTSIPTGIYTISAVLNDAATGKMLASQSFPIVISATSTNEATLNLSSPVNGERVPQSVSVYFNFDISIGGRLLVFEHSSLTQSPEDATADLNSPLKVVDVQYGPRDIGNKQLNAVNPGIAARPWTAGRKYSWLFLGSYASSSDVKKSPIWSFTVVPSDPAYGRLVDALANAPDPVGSTYQNLANAGYTINLTSSFYLQEGDNGTQKTIQLPDVLTFLRSLTGRNVQIKAGVVTQ